MKYQYFVFLLFLAEFNYVEVSIVSSKLGKIIGSERKDRNGNTFYSFRGIPYAKPPIGELRFKSPQPAEPWNDTLDATEEAPICMQFEFGSIIGQEDCLYLNVYTPKVSQTNSLLPVMVFIHGGAYFEGSANSEIYGPDYLITENIVLVTLNYRLGRFGSISFEDQTLGVPGNAHLKDQVMALKWVQDNIHAFCGDKNTVTIFGESVGGASVHMHMLSPMSKGLFHRAISQSGIALTAWNYGVLGTGKILAEKLNIEAEDDGEIIRQLQNVPAEKIMDTQSRDGLGISVHVPFEYSPVIERQTNEPAFLSELPIKIIESGNYNKVPFILGYNDRDMMIFQVISRLYSGKAFIFTDLNLTIPHDMDIKNDADRNETIEAIRKEFYKDSNDFSSIDSFIDLTLGPWCIASYYRALIRHLKTMTEPIYLYVFSADTKLNYFKKLHPVTAKYKGASHMDELGHLFKTKYAPCIDPNSPEEKALNNIVKLWTNFAKFGNPTPTSKSANSFKWLPVTDKQFNYLDINSELSAGKNPNEDIFKFWHELYKKFNGD